MGANDATAPPLPEDPGETIRGDDHETLVVNQPPEPSSPGTRRSTVASKDVPARPAAARVAGDASGTTAGDYQLVKMIGRGGMGAVYLARQTGLDREVAVKTILAEYSGERTVQTLFVSEALVTGELEHPGIVPVHDLGRTPEGLTYMSMKLVRGIEWAKLLKPDGGSTQIAERARNTGLREHLDILLKVCDAIAFAHSRDILHRDLKPANVMVGEFGEVQVMDWGIALSIGEPASSSKTLHRTAVKSPAGTPAYMPPELAKPEPDRMGSPSDVYLLGGILYEVLTGAAPHRGRNTQEVLAAARDGVVPPPEERAPDRRIPAELGRIAMRALAPEPRDRYPTATALAEAVRGYLSHEESLKLADEAAQVLKELDRPGAVPAAERYATYALALSRVSEALHLWPENEEAQRAQARAALSYADEALDRGDVGLAAAQMTLVRTHPHADARRRDALAAALAAGASARGRTRIALALLSIVAVALYAALGGTWHRVLEAEQLDVFSRTLGSTLEGAFELVRNAEIGPLAVPEAVLNDPALGRVPEYAERVHALRYARAILLWQRERWEELSELVATHGRAPAWPPVPVVLKTDRGRPPPGMPGGRPWTESDFAYFPQLVQVVIADPPLMPYLSAGLKNGKTGELLASLGRAASSGESPEVLDLALAAARELVGEAKAPADQRRWFALGAAAVRGQAHRAAITRGDMELARKLESWRLPFRLSLPKRAPRPGSDGTPLVWQEAPTNIGFEHAPPEWVLFRSGEKGIGFHYRATRRAPHVATAISADEGTVFMLTALSVVRLDWTHRQISTRTPLPGHPVLGWPDPIDRSKLVVMVADDGFFRGDPGATADGEALKRFLAQGGLLPLPAATTADPSGAVRMLELDPGAPEWPPTDAAGLNEFLTLNLAKLNIYGNEQEPIYQRKLGLLLPHVGQDRTDVNAALILLVRGRQELSPGVIAYFLRRLVPAAGQLAPEDEAQAAVLLEHAGFPQEARTLLAEAAHRFLAGGGNPHLASGAATGSLLRQVARAHPDKKSGAWGQEVQEASLHFAQVDPDRPPVPLDTLLGVWSTTATTLALIFASMTLYLMRALDRRSRATRLADLHGLGLRSARERTLAFLTHPVARVRHVWAAYATRFERLVVGLAGLTFLVALGLATTANRLQVRLRVFSGNPTDRLLAGGDALRVLELRRTLGSRSPALLRVLAESYRARGELAKSREALEELVRVAPSDGAGLNNLAVVLEESRQPGADAAFSLAAERCGNPLTAPVIAWNRARRGDLADPADEAESRMDPPRRRQARALRPTRGPFWELCRRADLEAAALDSVALRREVAKAVVFTVFEPGALFVRIRRELERARSWDGNLMTGGLAAAAAGMVTLLAVIALFTGVLAVVWLPLGVRPITDASLTVVERAPGPLERLLVLVPGLSDLCRGRPARGVLNLMLLAGMGAILRVAAVAEGSRGGSALGDWLRGTGAAGAVPIAGELALVGVAVLFFWNLARHWRGAGHR